MHLHTSRSDSRTQKTVQAINERTHSPPRMRFLCFALSLPVDPVGIGLGLGLFPVWDHADDASLRRHHHRLEFFLVSAHPAVIAMHSTINTLLEILHFHSDT